MDTDRTNFRPATQDADLTARSANDAIFASLQPVQTLVLDSGATRIRRKGERSKDDELWQGVGFGPDAPPQGVPLYLRIGPNPALLAEVLCGVLARVLQLPAPIVYLVQVPPGRMPRSRFTNAKTITLCVATEDIGGNTFAQLLDKDPEAVAPLLRDWTELASVTAFDEWLANPDRNMGNLLYVAQTIHIIDHAQAFGGDCRTLYPLADLTQVQFSNILGELINTFDAKRRPPLLQQMQDWLTGVAAATDIGAAVECAHTAQWADPKQKQELIDFITERLTITHSLLCHRLGHPQLQLIAPAP